MLTGTLTSDVVGELVTRASVSTARGTACPLATKVIPSSSYSVRAPLSGASSKSIVWPPRNPGTHSAGLVKSSSSSSPSPITWHVENSDVLPIGLVSVAVRISPARTGPIESESKLTVPPPELVRSWPRWRTPSPLPDGSQTSLA